MLGLEQFRRLRRSASKNTDRMIVAPHHLGGRCGHESIRINSRENKQIKCIGKEKQLWLFTVITMYTMYIHVTKIIVISVEKMGGL